VHAGVLPQWTAAQTLALAAEVEQALRGPDLKGFLSAMYGNTPNQWHDGLAGADRLRVIVNALTRLRFCTLEGTMNFASKEGAGAAPRGVLPWFEVPGRASQGTPMAFGHWSTLVTDASQSKGLRHNTLPLDTGCVWGGCLTAARLGAKAGEFELIAVQCEQAQQPAAD
jgi:bis(5'-nucleosyl)-tetraphosphatase (symmetrical)